MFPYIYFPHKIPLYSVMALLGLLSSIIWILKHEKECNYQQDVQLAFTWSCLGGIIGAKILYIITVAEEFISEFPLLIKYTSQFIEKYFESGFVFYGGLIGAVVSLYLYCMRNNIEFEHMTSVFLPAFPLFHAFGRIGCFCMGCCYGKETIHGGVVFHLSDICPNEIPLVPVQLYEATAEFLIFMFLKHMYKKHIRGGYMLSVYVTAYSVIRFILEFWRGDISRGFIGVFSTSQVISIILFTIFVPLLLRYYMLSKKGAHS